MLNRVTKPISCSAVIIAVPQHAQFLPDLLFDLTTGIQAFDEIVVVLSGFESNFVATCGSSVEFDERLLKPVHQPLQSAGKNRNFGLDAASGDLVFFMDADDLYSPHQIELSIELLKLLKFDLLLHGFFPFAHGTNPPPFPKPPADIRKIKFATENSLYEATLLRAPRNRALELRGETETTNLLFNDPAEAFEVHHAHAIVRREAVGDIRYHEEFGIRNEDGVFARDMLEAGKKVLLTPFVLSAYRHGARAKPRKPSNFFGRRR